MLTATSCRIQVVADLSPKPVTKSTTSATKLTVPATVHFVPGLKRKKNGNKNFTRSSSRTHDHLTPWRALSR